MLFTLSATNISTNIFAENNENYISQFTAVRSSESNSRVTVCLRQYSDDSTLNVKYFEFL